MSNTVPPYLIRKHADGCWHLTQRGNDTVLDCTYEFEFVVASLNRELATTERPQA